MKKKSLFKFFFKEYYNELEEKTKKIRLCNEESNVRGIELNELRAKINSLVDENAKLKDKISKLNKELKYTKDNIIESIEYKTLLGKYNELLSNKEEK